MPKRDDESEGFIFLDGEEDELPTATQAESCSDTSCGCDDEIEKLDVITINKPIVLSKTPPLPTDDEPYSAELITDGIHTFQWPIRGMDCPDCAMKATSATNKHPAITSCSITYADGLVNIEIDLAKGDLAEANRILSSLGHEPDVDWMHLSGVSIESVLQRQNCDQNGLKRLILSAPGVLDVRFQNSSILIRRPPSIEVSTRIEHELALERMTGKPLELVKGEATGLNPEQQRLIGASLALLLLPVVILLELAAAPVLFITLLGLTGTIVGGFRMFKEAVASIRNRVLAFQILTTLAVVGASLLQHWPEALMVVLLESVSEIGRAHV